MWLLKYLTGSRIKQCFPLNIVRMLWMARAHIINAFQNKMRKSSLCIIICVPNIKKKFFFTYDFFFHVCLQWRSDTTQHLQGTSFGQIWAWGWCARGLYANLFTPPLLLLLLLHLLLWGGAGRSFVTSSTAKQRATAHQTNGKRSARGGKAGDRRLARAPHPHPH